MALWNYDPYSFIMETPRRDPWGLFEPEPLEYWPESSLMLSPFGLPSRALRSRGPAIKPLREVVSDKDKYQVTLNLGDFKSNEMNVKVVDNSLVVCAEHEEKPDDHGHVYRHIKRRYMLPRNVDMENFKATFSDNGQLVVCAPKKPEEKENVRNIEIKHVPSESSSEISHKSEKPTTGKGKVDIPVSHEKVKK